MNKQKTKGLLSILAIVIILATIIVAVLVLLRPADSSNNGVEIQASTVKIARSSGNSEWYALYNVDGKNYATLIEGDNSKLTQGGKINIYYDINNPDKIWLNNGNQNNNLIIGIVIGAAAIISVIIIISIIVSSSKPQPLKTGSVTYQYNNSYETNNDSTYENDNNNNDINKF